MPNVQFTKAIHPVLSFSILKQRAFPRRDSKIELTIENPVLSEPLGYYTYAGTLKGIRGRTTASNSEDRLC